MNLEVFLQKLFAMKWIIPFVNALIATILTVIGLKLLPVSYGEFFDYYKYESVLAIWTCVMTLLSYPLIYSIATAKIHNALRYFYMVIIGPVLSIFPWFIMISKETGANAYALVFAGMGTYETACIFIPVGFIVCYLTYWVLKSPTGDYDEKGPV